LQAIISDLHANGEAFKMVLRDIESLGIDEIVCLGDFIGYGPDPKSCIDLALDFNIVLKGNHEEALLEEFKATNFNNKARAAIEWTREQLSMLAEDKKQNARRWDFLGNLETVHHVGDVTYVHGSPRDPIREYIYPRDVYRPKKLEEIFLDVKWVCFCGHTHVPGVWTEEMVYLSPQDMNHRYQLTSKKVIINCGSVGQPRDGDPRACYLVLDGDEVRWRRVEYDVEKTVRTMLQQPQLDSFLAERLRDGK